MIGINPKGGPARLIPVTVFVGPPFGFICAHNFIPVVILAQVRAKVPGK